MYLYFITPGDIRDDEIPVKIGITESSPEQRLSSIQTSHWDELHIAHWVRWEDTKIRELEKLLHKLLIPYHIRREWFRSCDRLRAVIADLSEMDPTETLSYLRRECDQLEKLVA